jgi:RNA polymerase sigma-70 factor (ECF subfamily)
MADEDSTPELVQRLQAGDARAAEELFGRYAQQLTRLAERHLSRRVASRENGEDVVQSVFRTFFRRNVAGEFQIDNSDQIWRLLVRITLRKARAKGRYHTAGVRNVGAEVAGDDRAWLLAAASRLPGPEEAVILVDQIEALLRDLPPLYCQVLDMRLQGQGVTEIAAELRVARQTVYRVLDLLQERLADSDLESSAGDNANEP